MSMKKIDIKSCVVGLIVGAIIMVSIPSFAANKSIQAFYNNIKLSINGIDVKFADGEEPFIVNGRTYVPAKYVAEGLGAKVSWNETDNTVVIVDKTVGINSETKNTLDTKNGEVKDTNTNLKDYTVPEIDHSKEYFNVTVIEDNEVQVTTYGKYNAIIYNNSTYVNGADLDKIVHIYVKYEQLGVRKFYKSIGTDSPNDDKLILETKNADPINYVNYNGYPYYNITFLGKYLED
jgi:hypothetical protein